MYHQNNSLPVYKVGWVNFIAQMHIISHACKPFFFVLFFSKNTVRNRYYKWNTYPFTKKRKHGSFTISAQTIKMNVRENLVD